MKVTFPHIGQVYIPASLILKELGIPCVIPPENSYEALERGKAVSPEEMCLPFKLMTGNLIQAYEKGAERVLMTATMGPCRLGEYGELMKQILDKSGYAMDWILLDSPRAIGSAEWLRRLGRAGQDRRVSGLKACDILTRGVFLMRRIDAAERQLKARAGYAEDPRRCIRMLRRFRQELRAAASLKDAFAAAARFEDAVKRLPLNWKKDPVRVLITGEIYTSIEDIANRSLEETLMGLGCSVRRPVNVSWWMKHTVKAALPELHKTRGAWLPYSIGGYAKETIEEMRRSQEDGIIKIMPAGCMPEIVAKAASASLEEAQGKRVLHLIFDEMQAGAGYETRVEAFVDMLERRKRVFPGN
ncbi:2-hydroxyglutaryl-CoA dehydratase [bacterium 210820-DFI.6.37]|nr:2-hydroxyglutaryl-CoA dehydratase [bacterium 210820-DFI.6.37]